MRCKKCGTDNPDNASYCRNCGSELSAIRKSRGSSDAYGAEKTYVYRKNVEPDPMAPAGYSAEPLSMWAYMGLTLLFCIPLAGFICLIVFSCGAVKNINLVNYSRGLLLLAIIAMILSFLLMYAFGLSLTAPIYNLISSY